MIGFQLGLVCFRLVGSRDENEEQVDELNKKLLTNINASGKLHMVPTSFRDRYVIRFCVVHQHASREDIGKLIYISMSFLLFIFYNIGIYIS